MPLNLCRPSFEPIGKESLVNFCVGFVHRAVSGVGSKVKPFFRGL